MISSALAAGPAARQPDAVNRVVNRKQVRTTENTREHLSKMAAIEDVSVVASGYRGRQNEPAFNANMNIPK
jgi:hypothetical protein